MIESDYQRYGRTAPQALERIASGIPGLDEILEGGLLVGGLHIVQGCPGTGKTILGNQICFNHARRGGRALYVTLLAEDHARMLRHIGELHFFDAALVPDRVYYVSAFPDLERGGLDGLMDLIRGEIRSRGIDVLVLDGLMVAQDATPTDLALKRFIHALQAEASAQDCTMLLLAGSAPNFDTAVHTMVDSVITLHSALCRWRTEQWLQVHKRRGGRFLGGRHAYRICDAGIEVYRRLGSRAPRLRDGASAREERLGSGMPALDEMAGGLPAGSATLLLGPSGSGKTSFALQYLSQADADSPGIYLGFRESATALRRQADALGLRLGPEAEPEAVELLRTTSGEGSIDQLCDELLQAVRRRSATRLVVDGCEGLYRRAADPQRVPELFAALCDELRAQQVTSVFTLCDPGLAGMPQQPPRDDARSGELSSIADNVIVMRDIEQGAAHHRLIAVRKVRSQRVDRSPRCFEIGQGGIAIDPDSLRATALSSSLSAPPAHHRGRSSQR